MVMSTFGYDDNSARSQMSRLAVHSLQEINSSIICRKRSVIQVRLTSTLVTLEHLLHQRFPVVSLKGRQEIAKPIAFKH